MATGSKHMLHLEEQCPSPLRVSSYAETLAMPLRGHSGWQHVSSDVCVRSSGHVPNVTPALSPYGPLSQKWCYVRFHDGKSETLSHEIVVVARVV